MKSKDIEMEFPESEIDDDYSDDSLYNIRSWGADLSFRELIQMYDEGELKKPELQRKYVWNRSEASRFIESILMGLPIPSIFLARSNNNEKLIIDGYQRIMTLYDYVQRQIFSNEEGIFRLVNSEKIGTRWRGKSFEELSVTEQRIIRSTTIHAIIFEQVHPRNDDTSLFQIFERINTSGRSLYPQEIRNCVYQGGFNTLLIEINQYSKWRELFGDTEEDSRMRDMELILRFFTLKSDKVQMRSLTSTISLKQELNLYMGDQKNSNEEAIKAHKDIFIETIDFIYEHIGISAFHNVTDTGKEIYKLNPTIFDALSIAVSYILENKLDIDMRKDFDSLRITLLQDKDFKEYTKIRTTKVEHIKGRIKLVLEKIFGVSSYE